MEGFSLESDELTGVTGHRVASWHVAQLGSELRYFVLSSTIPKGSSPRRGQLDSLREERREGALERLAWAIGSALMRKTNRQPSWAELGGCGCEEQSDEHPHPPSEANKMIYNRSFIMSRKVINVAFTRG